MISLILYLISNYYTQRIQHQVQNFESIFSFKLFWTIITSVILYFVLFFLSKPIWLNTKLVISELVVIFVITYITYSSSTLTYSYSIFNSGNITYLTYIKFRYSEKATTFLKNIPILFYVTKYVVQKKLGDFFKFNFCGLLRIYELYRH